MLFVVFLSLTRELQNLWINLFFGIQKCKRTFQANVIYCQILQISVLWVILTHFPFVPNTIFLSPLKTSEDRKVFWCFQRVEKGCIGNKWVNWFLENSQIFPSSIHVALHKKWSFSLRISLVNVTKSAENCRFDNNY